MSSWHNTRNFLSKLTPRRAWNMAKVYASYHLARTLRKPIQWGMPFSIAIEPTTSCNLRCPECPSGLRNFTRPTGMLEKEYFEKTINELYKDIVYLTFYFQGEPYLHKDFLDMVRYAKRKNIYTATSTNAHYLNDANAKKTVESGLDRLIISIDGTTQETYKQYRVGGKLNKVLEGARNMVKWKRQLGSATPHLVFQFLVVRPNEHQVAEVQQLAREIGMDEVILKTAQVYNYQQGNDLIPTIDQYARYRQQEDGSWKIKNTLDNSCWKLWHSCVITWDGRVVPCCFDKDADYQLGDSNTTPFRDIWFGEAYHQFRSRIVRSRQEIDICTNCSEGCKVNFSVEV